MKAGLAETQENISHAIVRALRLLHPPLEEQRLISAQAVRCDEREVQEVALLAKLCLLKQGLTEDLLTGRVRVTKLLENPGP
jgi:type I restriction enzyme S subunit